MARVARRSDVHQRTARPATARVNRADTRPHRPRHTLPSHVQSEVQRILDGAARRLLADEP
jgi:hypothetical protein